MPFASFNPTNPRTNPWNFHKKILRIGDFEKLSYFILSRLFWNFFCFIPMKILIITLVFCQKSLNKNILAPSVHKPNLSIPFSLCIRVDMVGTNHDKVLTQWRHMPMGKFRTNIFWYELLPLTSGPQKFSKIGVVKVDYFDFPGEIFEKNLWIKC